MLTLPDLLLSSNQPILIDMLETFQHIDMLDKFISELDPVPKARNVDYLYCGVYSFFEELLETVSSFSFLLAAEVLFTLQLLVKSLALFLEQNSLASGKNIHAACFQKVLPFLRKKLGLSAHKLLLTNWASEDSEIGGRSKGDTIQKILQIYLKNSDSTSDLLNKVACSVLTQAPSGTENAQEAVHSFPTLCPATLLTWCRVVHEENLDNLNKLVSNVILKTRGNAKNETVESILLKLQQAVDIVVSLVNMCKTHDKVAMHAMAVKYGGKFVDIFLKVFTFLQTHFQAHREAIIQLVKELQKATRTIQTLCSEAKGFKRTAVMNRIPATKRSMERYLFHVKSLLYNTSSGYTFWMGSLKHKDLYGQAVSSQLYDGDEEATEEQMEADIEEIIDVDIEEQNDGPDEADNENTASAVF